MKKINTNKDRLENLKERGDLIKESFQREFNKIKRVDEEFDWSKYEHKLSDEELDALGKGEADYEDKATRANLGEDSGLGKWGKKEWAPGEEEHMDAHIKATGDRDEAKYKAEKAARMEKQTYPNGRPDVNEYGDPGYPAGAEHDPTAPYNQPDPPEYESYEILDNGDNADDFSVTVTTNDGGQYSAYLGTMMYQLKASDKDDARVYKQLQLKGAGGEISPELEGYIEQICNEYTSIADDIEYNDPRD